MSGPHNPAADGGAEARALVAALLGRPWQWGDTSKAAKILGMRPSQLSPLLTGKRRMSEVMKKRFTALQPAQVESKP